MLSRDKQIVLDVFQKLGVEKVTKGLRALQDTTRPNKYPCCFLGEASELISEEQIQDYLVKVPWDGGTWHMRNADYWSMARHIRQWAIATLTISEFDIMNLYFGTDRPLLLAMALEWLAEQHGSTILPILPPDPPSCPVIVLER